MSRGLGQRERKILAALAPAGRRSSAPALTAAEIARMIGGADEPTTAALVSTRRALYGLVSEGLVVRLPRYYGRHKATWSLKTAAARNQARQGWQHQRLWQDEEDERRLHAAFEAAPENLSAAKTRIAKVLGMLGSGHEPEVLAAAQLAESERARTGKTWAELLGVASP